MKKFSVIGIILILLSLQLISCKKEKMPQVFSSANFIHASPGTASFQVFIDTIGPTNNTTVAYGASSGYIGFIPGNREVSIENRTATTKSIFGKFQADMEAGKAYSYFLYDTVDSKGLLKVLRLNDVLTPPSAANVSVRFLHLAPNAANMDVVLIRGTQFDSSSTSTQKLAFVALDSVAITGQSYVGNSVPNISALSEFKYSATGVTGNAIAKAATIGAVPAFNQNNRYIIKLKAAGTQTVLLQSASVTLLPGRIYTVFARGTAKGQPLAVSLAQHF